ncbi:MAG: type III pantothenate kinase [bacterium]|nr:type III pantothenate kinase [bacterium]
MGGTPLVTFDIGNTRCKACLFPAGQATQWILTGEGAPRALWDCALDELEGAELDALRPGVRAAISCVADESVAAELVRRVAQRIGASVPVNPPSGLALEVEHSETVGRDRLFAARGALELERAPAVVVDAGTALTVDALDVDAEGGGRFLGGAIAPGPDLLADVLAARGARLARVPAQPRVAALGRHTRAALAAGIGVGFEGAALHLVRRIADEAGLASPRLWLTGGRAEFLAHLEWSGVEGPARHEPLLVHLGLAAAFAGVEGGAP